MSALTRKAAAILSLTYILVCMSGCQSKTTDLVNTQTISLEDTKRIEVTYASENITVYENDSNTLVLKEYMSVNKPDYYAGIDSDGGNIKINSGKRPPMMKSYIEVYVPKSFDGDFSLNTSSGKTTISTAYSFNNFNAKTASGAIEIKEITANENNIETSSGAINISQLTSRN